VRKDTIDSRNDYQNPRNAYIPASQASSSKPIIHEPEPMYNQQPQYGNQQNIVSLNGEEVSNISII
jgi:hypothetical protein